MHITDLKAECSLKVVDLFKEIDVMQGIQERMYVIFGKGGIKNVKIFAVLNETMTVIRRRVSHDQSA